jgi:hypothetical protein
MLGAFLVCLKLQVSVSLPGMENSLVQYRCAYCGEMNETPLDATVPDKQSYVEDCTVCCRPNVIRIRIDQSTGHVRLEAEFEG